MSNFTSVPYPFIEIVKPAIEAENFVYDNTEVAGLFLRKGLEAWVHFIYQNEPELTLPYDTTISSLIKEPTFIEIVNNTGVLQQMNAIRLLGNKAVHNSGNKVKISTQEIIHHLHLLHGISYYFINLYGEEYIKPPQFSDENIPLAQKIQQNILNQEILKLKEQLSQKAELEKENAQLQAQMLANRLATQSTVLPPKDPNEALTRTYLIDNLLQEAGWDLSLPNVKEFRIEGMPNNKEEGFADYVLWGKNGKPLAVVEAKRTNRDPQVGRHQAELYAKNLENKYGQKPNIFLTNGYEIHFYDWNYPIRQLQGFYTQDELELNIQRRNSKIPLHQIDVNANITDRYYQIEAIKAVANRMEAHFRGALLVMATGTGKTRTAASLVDVFTKANWAKRILFLADRTALVKQAKDNLNDYLPHIPSVNLLQEKEDQTSRLVFSTYQTMINLIDKEVDGNQRKYGVGHFDVVIFDEIHRSVYNKYKAVFNYFDAYKIGLTATPKDTTDKNTYELFDLSEGNPTYNYDLDKAVEDGYLVPYKSYSVSTHFQRNGIKYHELSDEEKREYEEKFGDPETGEIPDEIDASALDSWIYNTDTADKILDTLMQYGIRIENGEKLGKTIIFAKKHDHAEFIRKRFNANYPHYKDQFLKVIDYQAEYKHDLLSDFKLPNKMPQIACSVDMLDTGIDVPEVVNLVFLRPVKSNVKFWQMIGRGTRLCKNLFGYQDHKKEFLILDFCQNFEFFSENPKGTETERPQTLNEKLFNFKLRLSQILLEQKEEEEKKLGIEFLDQLHQQVVLLYIQEKNSFIVRQHLKLIEKFQDRNTWNNLSQSEKHELITYIAPLVFDTDTDSAAKSFDLLMFDLILSRLTGTSRQKNLTEKVVKTGKNLSKQTRIPQVAAKIQVVSKMYDNLFWQDITSKKIDHLRLEVRELIKFLETDKREFAVTHFEDQITKVEESPAIYEALSFDKEAYKEKIQQYVMEHKTDLTIDKIRKNIKVTPADIQYLEKMLFEQGEFGNKETFTKAFEKYDEDGNKIQAPSLGEFIRSVVGLDKTEAKNAFAKIADEANFNHKQMQFVNLIIDYFSENGVVEIKQLMEYPFKDIDTRGIIHLFGNEKAQQIVDIVNEINRNCRVEVM